MAANSAKGRKTLTENQLMTKTRNELVKMLLNTSDGDVNPTNEPSLPPPSNNAFHNNDLISLLKPLIKEATQGLEDEIKLLRSEVMQLKEQLNQSVEEVKETMSVDAADRASFSETVVASKYSDVIKKSVQTVLQEDKLKSELILSKVDEKEHAQEFIAQLCEKINYHKKPVDIKRLGKKTEDRNRVIKLTLPTPFEARTFTARYMQEKDREDVPNIRIRPCRSTEEQKVFTKSNSKVYAMNKKASEANRKESFSLRPNGEIWRFYENDAGSWVRDRSWSLPEEEAEN